MAEIPSAKLAGLISMAPTSQGFVLPIFVSPQHSNSYLVQVLAGATEIKAFGDLVSDEQVIPTYSDEVVALGDEPLWAFQVAPSVHVVARASKFRSELMRILTEQEVELDSFVKWEVERLFGQSEQRRTAVRNLHRTMTNWNAQWADYWLANLFILPTIRQQIEQIALPHGNDDVAAAIKALQIECSAKGVLLRPKHALMNWIDANYQKFSDAMKVAGDEWQDTGIGVNFFVNRQKIQTITEKNRVRKVDLDVSELLASRRALSPPFTHGRIVFDKSWSPYERRLGMSLIDDIAAKLSPDGFDAELEKLSTRSPPRIIASYSAKARSTSPTQSLPRRHALRASLMPSLRLICGSDYRFLLGLFRRMPRSLALHASDINVLLFRSRDEAEEVLTKLEGLTSHTQMISQIWIAEPRSSSKQLELSYLNTAVYRQPKFLGYIQPPKKRFSFSRSLPNIQDRRYFLVIADDQTIKEAEFVARLMTAAKVSPQPGPIDVVICIVGDVRRSSQIVRLSLPGVHVVYVETPSSQLLQRAFAVFSTLGSFCSGMFASLRSPIVLVRSERQRNSTISFAASNLNAAVAEIHPSTPLERQNRTNIRRALSEATNEVQYSGVARRRSTASRGRVRAVEHYERLVDEKQDSSAVD